MSVISKANLDALNKHHWDCKLKYRGYKGYQLAYAINLLIGHADEFDTFIDLFAGSGSATSNIVIEKSDHEFIMNEINFAVSAIYRLFSRAEYDYKIIRELKAELKNIQSSLSGNVAKDFYDKYKDYTQITDSLDTEDKFNNQNKVSLPQLAAYEIYLKHPIIDGAFGRGNKSISDKRMTWFSDIDFERYIDLLYDKFVMVNKVFNYDALDKNSHSNLYDGKKCLIYADPPYLNTNAGNYNSFSEDNMRDLIDMLCNSGHQFIFSCRPRVRVQRGNYLDIEEKKDKNGEVKNEDTVNAYRVYDYYDDDDIIELDEYEYDQEFEWNEKGNCVLSENNKDNVELLRIYNANTAIYECIFNEFKKHQSDESKYYVVSVDLIAQDPSRNLDNTLLIHRYEHEIFITNIDISKSDVLPINFKVKEAVGKLSDGRTKWRSVFDDGIDDDYKFTTFIVSEYSIAKYDLNYFCDRMLVNVPMDTKKFR